MARTRSWRAIARSTSRVSGRSCPLAIGHVHRVDAQPEAPELVLEPRPLGNLVPVLRLGPAGRLRGRVDRRHPDDPRALARGDLDRESVHAADGPVEGQRADDPHLREERRDDLRALGGGRVVRLEGEAREPELGEALRERAVVDPPPRHVRSDVDVQVVGTLHENTRPLARRRPHSLLRRHGRTPPCGAPVASSARTAALAAAIRGSTPSSSSSSRAASISSTRRTACRLTPLDESLEQRLADDSGDLSLEPRRL